MSTQIAQPPRATTVPVSAPETALAPLAYICQVCQWVYDPAMGDPEHGIAPGTAFEDIPDDWYCPDCGVTKTDFTVHEF